MDLTAGSPFDSLTMDHNLPVVQSALTVVFNPQSSRCISVTENSYHVSIPSKACQRPRLTVKGSSSLSSFQIFTWVSINSKLHVSHQRFLSKTLTFWSKDTSILWSEIIPWDLRREVQLQGGNWGQASQNQFPGIGKVAWLHLIFKAWGVFGRFGFLGFWGDPTPQKWYFQEGGHIGHILFQKWGSRTPWVKR